MTQSPHAVSTGPMPLRTTVLVAVAILALIAAVVSAPAIWSSPGIFGWNVGPDGVTIVGVTPEYPAARARIVRGDRIVFATLPLRGRFNTVFDTELRLGERITFDVEHRGERRTVTLETVAWPATLWGVAQLLGLLAGIIGVAVGITLVALRPNAMTWGFLCTSAPALVPFNAFSTSTDTGMATVIAANGVAAGIAIGGAFVFVSRFPSGEPRPTTAWLDRAAVPWGLVVTATWLYLAWELVDSAEPPPHALLIVVNYGLPMAGAAVLLATLFANYAEARGGMRQRILPVIVTLAASTFFSFAWTLASQLTTSPATLWTEVLAEIFNAAVPISVAYAVFRYRVIDVDFVVSRTLVYSILTATIIGTYALVHYLVGKLLERTRLAVAIELALAVAYGVWLNALQERVQRWVDRLLFKRRHQAAVRLERISSALPHAESADLIDEALVTEAADALVLASAAVFRRDDHGDLIRRRAFGWTGGLARSLASDDRLVTQLRAELAPIDLAQIRWLPPNVPSGVAQPQYAIPVALRHDLSAIVLYGGHAGGEALDPEELRLLRRLSRSAALAYEQIGAAALRRRVVELEAQNAALLDARSVLTEAAQALRDEAQRLGRSFPSTPRPPT